MASTGRCHAEGRIIAILEEVEAAPNVGEVSRRQTAM